MINPDCLPRQNENGGTYDHGRRYPQVIRERILDLHHDNFSQRDIVQATRVSKSFVQKVIGRYDKENTSLPAVKSSKSGPLRKIDENVLEYLEVEKLQKPSMYASELKERLLLDGVLNRADLPSSSQINRRLRHDLLMTKKKLSVLPSEANNPQIIQLTDDYLLEISQINPTKLRFFDESSVIKTTCNRKYGNSTIGTRAIEHQRYASNANFTINLLISYDGVHHFNILDGPSNGMELLIFFEDALQIQNPDGSVILERGDVIVMDNCGFHHGHFVEPVLRNMLGIHGVGLIFQPPYSPHLNPCEQSFNQMKDFLRREQRLAKDETKIAVGMALQSITSQNTINYYKQIGYL